MLRVVSSGRNDCLTTPHYSCCSLDVCPTSFFIDCTCAVSLEVVASTRMVRCSHGHFVHSVIPRVLVPYRHCCEGPWTRGAEE